ncbi:MAG: DNA gyrase subunit A [Patescibacteria group bacterium]|jgi:DNA gyrase subunit A
MAKKKVLAKKSSKPAPKQSPQPQQEEEQQLVAKAKDSAIGVIEPRRIVEEMQESYLDYAMSVIVSRALPDVRDGLKPVHRRVLYAMWSLGLRSGAKFRKSATVVGEVLGKYHPHSDTAVYDTLVRLAQDFSLRYPLVNGQGNFGSIDGDTAAAMRYTESKLQRIADEILFDIEKETVPFVPNYDGAHKEPTVFPAKLPNLLLNGSTGIAVGMATNIPPHNLNEVVDGTIHLIDHPTATVEDLMEFVKGPDFPTGGAIFDRKEIAQAYGTGKGSIVTRGKAEIVEKKDGQFQIIISEIPYMVNKSRLIEKMADLVREKRLEGIRDIRDGSDRNGIHVVIDLKKDSYPKKVLNRLYQTTQLQETFHVNMLALVDGIQPRILNLKMILEEYIKHREDVVRKRTAYDLGVAKERAHILEGLKKALDNIDAVIKLIKASKDKEVAKVALMKRFKFSERQTIAILEMRLQQLANLERKKIEDELKEKKILIKELETLLASRKMILNVIKDELKELKEKHGDERRTEVFVNPIGKFTQEDLIPNEPCVIITTRDGYIKRMPEDTFKSQGRGGKGVIGLTTKEEDQVDHMFAANTHADLLFFTTRGRVFQLKAYDVPLAGRQAKGQALVNFLQLTGEEKVTVILSLEEMEQAKDIQFFVMVTSKGTIKRVKLEDFKNVRRSGLIAIKLKDGDYLKWVKPSGGKDHILLAATNGQSIRFPEGQIRVMGRSAAGVRGIRLKDSASVAGMAIIAGGKTEQGEQLLVIMDNGYGKRTPLAQYRVQGRGGSGIKAANVSTKTGSITSAFTVNAKRAGEDIIVISDKGQVIRMPLKSVSVLGRATQGVRIMRFSEAKDSVSSVTFVEAVVSESSAS